MSRPLVDCAPVLEAKDIVLASLPQQSRLHLSLLPGRQYCVFAGAGGGKSAFAQVLVGESRPASGTISFLGRDVTRLPLWRRARAGLGYLPKWKSILARDTVKVNVETFLRASQTVEDAAEQLLEHFQLSSDGETRAGQLAPGPRRRLELLRVSVLRPRAVVCDEPFFGLSGDESESILAYLQELAGGGAAIVVFDPGTAAAEAFADESYLLEEGRVVPLVPSEKRKGGPELVRCTAG